MSRPVLLIDGHCVLCNRYALWVSRHDTADRVRFHAIQSSVAQRWLQARGLPSGNNPDTVYLVHGAQVLKKSGAFFALVAELEGPVRWLRWLRWTCALGADLVYDFVAHRRYRWFGREATECSLLHAAQLGHRILNDDDAARVFAELDEATPRQGEASVPVTSTPGTVRRWGDRVWMVLLLAFCSAQISLTVLDRNAWPLSSHNFFAFQPGVLVQRVELELTAADGRRLVGVPGQFMPIEFFRANRIVQQVFAPDEFDEPKRQLAAETLRLLRTDPWPKFDETLPAITAGSADFLPVQLDVVVEDRWYDPAGRSTRARVSERHTIFSYRLHPDALPSRATGR